MHLDRKQKKLDSEEEFKKKIREKLNLKEKQEKDIKMFSAWWNSNCATIIEKKTKNGYTVRLVINRFPSKKENNIFIKRFPSNPLKTYSTLNKAEEKVYYIEKKLDDDNPI